MKKYTVNVENDRIVSVEVDGVRYTRADQIPDEQDRERVEMMVFSFPDAEWEAEGTGEMAARPFLLPKLIVPLFLGVAVLMLGIALAAGIGTARRLGREAGAPGRVIELVERPGQDGSTFYYPIVEFTLPDGTRQAVELTEGSWPPAYEPGDRVTVRYNPARPAEARIGSLGGTLLQWTVTLITGFLGLAFAAATILAWWVMKTSP